MGLAFLPWERLPAYVLGGLLIALGVVGFWPSENSAKGDWILAGAMTVGGCALIWRRYVTGREPLWSDERNDARFGPIRSEQTPSDPQ
ncbi:hypothetical protein ACNI65_16120 [Roseateles sp. So40a]|uniref:hypothetical protein n=1 Tax=Roseateles sp. So40a TaxID=3400226 RepID=UPI003A8AC485